MNARVDQTNPQFIIEQYKAKLTDLSNVGARQTAMTAYYVSIVSALFGVLAFKDRSLLQVDPYVIAFISITGMLVSWLWMQGINYFKNLFRIKFQVLAKIEQSLPFQTFDTELQEMKKASETGWLWNERFVPAVFFLFFLLLAAVRLFKLQLPFLTPT